MNPVKDGYTVRKRHIFVNGKGVVKDFVYGKVTRVSDIIGSRYYAAGILYLYADPFSEKIQVLAFQRQAQ